MRDDTCNEHSCLETHIVYIKEKVDEISVDQKKVLSLKDRVATHTWLLGGVFTVLFSIITYLLTLQREDVQYSREARVRLDNGTLTDNYIKPVCNEDGEYIVDIAGGSIDINGGTIDAVVPPSTDFATYGQDVTAAAVIIPTTSLPSTYYMLIQADIDNTKPIYVGKATVTTSGATRGTQLVAGQNATYPVLNGGTGVYVIAEDTNQKVIVTLFNGAV